MALVERVRDEFGIQGEVRAVLIADQEAAERARFPGSPTVRVDGRDVEPGADPPAEITLDCRLYRHPHRLTGPPRADLTGEQAPSDAGCDLEVQL